MSEQISLRELRENPWYARPNEVLALVEAVEAAKRHIDGGVLTEGGVLFSDIGDATDVQIALGRFKDYA